MEIYIVFMAFPVIWGLICNSGIKKPHVNYDDKTKRNFLIVCGIVLFLMIALRSQYNGSTDSENYYSNWKEIAACSFADMSDIVDGSIMEPGYLYTVWLLSRVFRDPQWVFVLSGVLMSVSVCRFLYKNCEDVVLGMVMFNTLGLYSFMVQGLRQAVAMSICLFAIEYCKKRKPVQFVLIVLLAFMYHKSALLFLVVYLLYGLKLDMITGVAMTCAYVALLLFSGTLVVLGNDLFERTYSDAVSGGGYVAVAVYALVILAAVLFSKNKAGDKSFAFFVYMTGIGFVMFVARYFNAQILERVSFYYMFGQIIALTGALRTLDKVSRQWLTVIVMLLCMGLGAYRLKGSDMIPYEFFWQT